MGKSWQIGKIQGIPILVHWTLGLFIFFFIGLAHNQKLSFVETTWLLAFLFFLFFCIVLHELGHALTAKYYDVTTKDIILSPIGGLARLEKVPDQPLQEFWIALNGPLVNIGISLMLSLYFFITNVSIIPNIQSGFMITDSRSFLQILFWMNLMVFLFNLIPAFPMDGGRILRSLLRLKFDRLKSTQIAVFIGRSFAISFLAFSIWNSQFILGIIGLFIYFMAGQELKHVKLTNLLSTFKVADLINPDQGPVLINQMERFEDINEKMHTTKSSNFIVVDDDKNPVGTLPHWFIKSALKEPNKYVYISDLMSDNYKSIDVNTSLEDVFNTMQSDGLAIIGVMEEEKMNGSIDRDQLSRFIATNS